MPDILHICATHSGHKGLGWNAWHTTNVLQSRGITAEWVQLDEKDIATAIEQHKPRVAVIMALWVTSATLSRLAIAFPATTFIVKNHSGPQFLSQESRGWQLWLEAADLASLHRNVRIAAIKPELVQAMCAMKARCVELPNVYTESEIEAVNGKPKAAGETDGYFHIGVFGAFRPLKNAVGMAAACALVAGRRKGPTVLNINGSRMEMGSNRDLDIITQICIRSGLGLLKHDWLEHEPFKALASRMNVCCCASYHDTYNYVAADCVSAGGSGQGAS